MMHRLSMGAPQIRQAIGWFDSGKAKTFPLLETIRKLRRNSARQPKLRGLLVRFLMEVSLSKASLHQHERTLLWTICRELDIGRVELAQLEAMLRAQRGFRKSPAGNADAARVREAYATLGVDRSSTNAEIKKAYRRLMSRNHAPWAIQGSRQYSTPLIREFYSSRHIRLKYINISSPALGIFDGTGIAQLKN